MLSYHLQFVLSYSELVAFMSLGQSEIYLIKLSASIQLYLVYK